MSYMKKKYKSENLFLHQIVSKVSKSIATTIYDLSINEAVYLLQMISILSKIKLQWNSNTITHGNFHTDYFKWQETTMGSTQLSNQPYKWRKPNKVGNFFNFLCEYESNLSNLCSLLMIPNQNIFLDQTNETTMIKSLKDSNFGDKKWNHTHASTEQIYKCGENEKRRYRQTQHWNSWLKFSSSSSWWSSLCLWWWFWWSIIEFPVV